MVGRSRPAVCGASGVPRFLPEASAPCAASRAQEIFSAILILFDKTSCILYVFMIYNIKRRTVLGLANGSRQPPASDPPVAARRLSASARYLAPPPATRQGFRLRPP